MPGRGAIKRRMWRSFKSWGKHHFGKNKDGAESDMSEFMQKEMAHARLGVLYLFGTGTYSDSSFASVCLEGIGGAMAGGMGVQASATANVGQKAVANTLKFGTTGAVEIAKIREDKWNDVRKGKSEDELKAAGALQKALEDLEKKVQEKIQEKLGWNRDGVGTYTQIIKSVVSNFVSIIIKEATQQSIPLSGFFDIAKGVTEGGYSIVRRIDAAMVRNNTSFVSGGHTEAMLDALERAMWQSAGEGALRTLKGSLNVGLTLTAGSVAGGLASLIVGIAEAIYKIIWRLIEMQAINEFIEDAKGYWAIHKTAAFHEDGEAFTEWYRDYALRAPVIACATLNSGICGSAWHYLNLYSGDGLTDQQAQFNKGSGYLERLRPYAQWYQKRSGVYFSSTNAHVKDILKAAKDRGAKLTGMEAETRKITGVKDGQRVYDKKGTVKHRTPASFGSAAWDILTK